MQLGLGLQIDRLDRGSVLTKYSPGLTIPGEAFTRASTATYFDANGVLQTASSGVKRDSHYVGGVRTLLLESSVQNVILQNSDCSQAVWSKSFVTTTANAYTGPNGTLSMMQLASDGSVNKHSVFQTYTSTAASWTGYADLHYDNNQWMTLQLFDGTTDRRACFDILNGVLGITTNGATSRIASLGGNNYRCYITIAAAAGAGTIQIGFTNANDAGLNALALTGAKVGIANVQAVASAFASSSIATTTAAVTRAVDAYSISGVTASGSPRLYQRYWDLATSAWVDSDTAYTSGAAIVPAVDRAYAGIGVFRAALTTAQYRAALGI